MMNRFRLMMRLVLAGVAFCVALGGARAQGVVGDFVKGDAIISVAHGTAVGDVQAIAAGVNASVVKGWPSVDSAGAFDAYHLRTKLAVPTVAATVDAVAILQTIPGVTFAGLNRICQPTQVGGVSPNDPRYNEQWDKLQIRMPEAWTIEKGKDSVTIVIVDTGVDTSHPEFPKSRQVPGYNAVSKLPDGNPATPATDTHGTHVAGIAMAQANNSIGVAGVVWDNVKLMPVYTTFAYAELLDIWQLVLADKAKDPTRKYVINMSFRAVVTSDVPDLTDPNTQAILKVADAGIICVPGAGNDATAGNPPAWPAQLAQSHRNIICVTATNHLGQRALYSTFRPYTTIAAPGGDDAAGKMILSTVPVVAGSYDFMQGTSMAAPQVTGGAALMLSIPGVEAGDIKNALTATARPVAGASIPSPEYGSGVMDVYAALLRVAVGVTVMEPDGTGGKANLIGSGQPDPVETLRPTVRISVNQIMPTNLVVKVNDTVVTDWTVENVKQTVKDSNQVDVPVRFDAVIEGRDFSPGVNRIDVTGVKPGTPDVTVTDTRTFQLIPHTVAQGRSLVSIPYFQSGATPEVYFGSAFRLARWVPSDSRYAVYSSYGPKEAGASFNPNDTAPRPDGGGDPVYPLGLAYWADVESIKPVLTYGAPVADRSFIIPLSGTQASGTPIAWNMVGDPFNFDVPFNALLVDTPEGRITVSVAADRGYLLPNIYTYDGADGYTFKTLPDGALYAWRGHWVGVTSSANIALVVPPVKISRAASAARVSTNGGWMLRFSASSGTSRDKNNYIGVSKTAADGYDRSDVAKPPALPPSVTVGVRNDDWGAMAGTYAKDIRAVGGTDTWNVVAGSDIANSAVTVQWASVGAFPRNVKLVLTDETSGQRVDMRVRSSYTFRVGENAEYRTLKVTAQPAGVGAIRVTDLAVRSSGRSAGAAQISFNVTGDATCDVKILGASGRAVSSLATRAASAGQVQMVWNGKDSAGRSVPAGTYLVQVRAMGSDGEAVRVIQPFALVR